METKEKVYQELDKRFNRLVGTSATNLCTHCGWCIESCHIFKATGNPDHSPVAKAEKVRRVLKKKHDWMSRLFPKWTGRRGSHIRQRAENFLNVACAVDWACWCRK